MPEKKRSAAYLKFGLYLLVVVLVNMAGITLFLRFDLTAGKIYSLSAASKEVVSTLSEPLTINVFFSRNLPAPYNSIDRYLRDLLEEYAVHSNRFFNYRFYDVSAEEGDIPAQAQENQKLASTYGIHPIQIQAVEKDEVKFQRVYMGLVMIHGDLIERIPTIATTDGLEYRITTAVQKMNHKISALLRLTEKIRVKLYLSSALNAVAPYMGLKQLCPDPLRRRPDGHVDQRQDLRQTGLRVREPGPRRQPGGAFKGPQPAVALVAGLGRRQARGRNGRHRPGGGIPRAERRPAADRRGPAADHRHPVQAGGCRQPGQDDRGQRGIPDRYP